MDYAENLRKLKIHLASLDSALLHNKWSEVATIMKAMKMRMSRIEEFVEAKTAKNRPT